MADAIAILFNSDDGAMLCLRTLREIEKAGQVSFNDTAVIARDPEGNLHVKNELDSSTETGMTVGAVIGALFGPLGLIAGLVGGAAVGSSAGEGVDDELVDEVEKQLGPDKSALFLSIREANADALVAALNPFQGTVIRSTLTPEAEEVINLAMQ